VSDGSGQYIAYTFFRVDPAWRRLPVEERTAAKDAFADALEDFAPRFDTLRAYSTTGVRADADFFLWKITSRYEDLGELGAALNGTPLAAWLETPYSYLGTTKASAYTGREVIKPVDPSRQGRYYTEAIRLARQQPTVEGIYLFHITDETRLEGLQSGVRYADSTAKPSLEAVREASLRP